MAITATDLEVRLTGGASNTSPAASLGGAMSTVSGGLITTAVANNLFDDVSSAEATAGDVEYRGFAVKNAHGSLQLQNPAVWIDTLTSSADTEVDIGMAVEAINVTMATIANESTAPTSVTFSRPTTKSAGQTAWGATGLNAGQFRGIWMKRTVTASASAASDSCSITFGGDTAP
jgi:hypothetical protein